MRMVSLRFIVRSIAASLAQPADLERGDWASEAFELEVACRRGLHGLLHSCEKALADQDLPRRCPSAEPRGEIRHRSEDAVVVATLESDAADGRVASLDADSEPELRTAPTPDLSQPREPLLCGEREPNGLQFVICDRERIVEEDHQPVACKVLERPFVGGDEVADHSVVLA